MAVVSNGTTIIDAGALGSGVPTGKMILIKTLTASGSGTLSFVNGAASVVLDDTYDSYVFKFIDIHPSASGNAFSFNGSVDTGSNYNVTKTTTNFGAYHREDDSAAVLNYETSQDLAQSTAFQGLAHIVGAANDECCAGELKLFNPSSTTFVKHFSSVSNRDANNDYQGDNYTAGYFNTTSAIDAIQFKMSSGNIDSGVIKLYGIGG